MSAKIKIALLAGGPSTEHEVSLASAKNILSNLDKSKYEVTLVLISKDNLWGFGKDFDSIDTPFALDDGISKLKSIQPELVFIGLHGTFGEDGTLQALLEKVKLKFTGSGSKASSMAFNKLVSQKIVKDEGFKIIDTIDFTRSDWVDNPERILTSAQHLKVPLIVKPVEGGSSLGIFLNKDYHDLSRDIEASFEFSNHLMIQPFIDGREFSCGVIEQEGKPRALEVTEIFPVNQDFFNYESKYTPGSSQEITPASINEAMTNRMKSSTITIHKAHGCSGYSRTDFLLKGKDIYFIEINTLPGMTQTSLLPQEANAMGIKFSELLDIIIKEGLKQ
jgi:D-alanine-D-alanine ligase